MECPTCRHDTLPDVPEGLTLRAAVEILHKLGMAPVQMRDVLRPKGYFARHKNKHHALIVIHQAVAMITPEEAPPVVKPVIQDVKVPCVPCFRRGHRCESAYKVG